MLPNKRLFAISLAGIAVQLTMAYPALQDDPSLKTYGNYAFDILPTTNGVKQRFPQERDHAMVEMLDRMYRTTNKIETRNLAAVPRQTTSLHKSRMAMDSNTPGLGFPMKSRLNLNLRQLSKRPSSSQYSFWPLNMVDYLVQKIKDKLDGKFIRIPFDPYTRLFLKFASTYV